MRIVDLLVWTLALVWLTIAIVLVVLSSPGAGVLFSLGFLVPVLIIWLVSEKCEKFNRWLSKKLK